MKIVITDADTVRDNDVSLDVFENYGEVITYGITNPEDTLDRVRDADIILCNKTLITADIMSQTPNLKYIGIFATGYNNIDIDYANRHGITVCNVPGYSTEAVVQHTFAFILNILNKVSEYNKLVSEGEWIKSKTFSYFPLSLSELSGKTIGIVGYGTIGHRVADVAKAFNMKVLVCNRHKVNDDSVKQVPLDDLLSNSDIVTLHCPLNADSINIMNEESFNKMKDNAIFINTGRGPLVDEMALRKALESGKLMGAGIDVLCKEPMAEDCPLFGAPNCFITPHVAWAGVETRKRLVDIMVKNLEAFLQGNTINKVV